MPPNNGESLPNIEYSVPESGEQTGSLAPETLPASPENKPQKSVQASRQAATDLALPSSSMSITAQQPADDKSQAQVQSSPKVNTDRIDKVWLDRLKSVIDQTRDDPFEQKKALSKVQADYIKQNFNKTIKTGDSAD